MKTGLIKTIVIVMIAAFYALVAFPLPYLLLDHASAMQSGDGEHSDRDIHAWLEWAASSSLAESPPPVPPLLAPLPSSSFPSEQVCAVWSGLARHLRGPPTLACNHRLTNS